MSYNIKVLVMRPLQKLLEVLHIDSKDPDEKLFCSLANFADFINGHQRHVLAEAMQTLISSMSDTGSLSTGLGASKAGTLPLLDCGRN